MSVTLNFEKENVLDKMEKVSLKVSRGRKLTINFVFMFPQFLHLLQHRKNARSTACYAGVKFHIRVNLSIIAFSLQNI